MVQSTKDRPRFDTPGALNEPSNRKNPRNSGLPEISTIDAESPGATRRGSHAVSRGMHGGGRQPSAPNRDNYSV